MLDKKKFQNAALYFAQKCKQNTVGLKKMAKLLYYLDFDHYEKHFESVTGAKYIHWKMGPVPENYYNLIDEMAIAGLIAKESKDLGYENPMQLITPLRKPKLSIFKKSEIDEMNKVIEMWGQFSGKDLEEASHNDVTFTLTELNEEIPYQLALHR